MGVRCLAVYFPEVRFSHYRSLADGEEVVVPFVFVYRQRRFLAVRALALVSFIESNVLRWR